MLHQILESNLKFLRFRKIVGIGERYDSFLNSIFSSQYRFYFDVDNSYVIKKILMTLVPFIYRGDWTLSTILY